MAGRQLFFAIPALPRPARADDRAAQNPVFLVKHGELSRCDGPLRLLEVEACRVVVYRAQFGRGSLMPGTNLHQPAPGHFRLLSGEPVQSAHRAVRLPELLLLAQNQPVVRRIDRLHIPGRGVGQIRARRWPTV